MTPPYSNIRALDRDSNLVRLTQRHERTPSDACILAPLTVGLCGTDLQILNGTRPDTARVLGHEGAVRVDRAPPWAQALLGITSGQIYVVNPVNPGSKLIIGHNMDGLLQSHLALGPDQLASDMLVSWPKALPVWLAPLAEPLAAAIYAVELVGSGRPLGACAIIGAGPMGLTLLTYLRRLGVEPLSLGDHRKEPLTFAVSRGLVRFNEVCAMSEQQTLPLVDTIFFCASRHEGRTGLEAAIEALRPRGRLDLIAAAMNTPVFPGFGTFGEKVRRANHCGFPQPGLVTSFVTPEGKTIDVTGHRGTSVDHLKKAISVLAAAPQAFTPIIGTCLTMASAADVMTRACQGERWAPGKVIVEVNSVEPSA